jgi:hypothetical protein
MLKLGNTTINKIYLGSTEAKKIYLGSTLVHDTTGGGAFAPSDLANLIAWYDASDTATITHSGGAVSQINDKESTHHLVQATGSAQPTTGTRTLNSLNVLDFTASHFLADTSFPVPSSGNIMLALVFRVDDATSSSHAALSMDASVDFEFQSINSSFLGRLAQTGTGGAAVSASPTITEGVDVVLVIVWDFTTGKMRFYRDGTMAHTDSSSNDYTTKLSASQTLRIFANRSGTPALDGMWAELAICEEVDGTSREKLEGYLAHKWALTGNLPGGHPYKSVAP